jgi:lipoyl(octanoyl) transferase
MSCPREKENDLRLNACQYQWLGQVDYQAALHMQNHLVMDRVREESQDSVLFLEHPPAYTLGQKGNPTHLLISEQRLRGLGARLYRVNRGGDITFHGPGQLVGYPIMDLDKLEISLSDYVRGLEEVLIRTLSAFGVAGGRIKGFPGVWTGTDKIAAIGVRVNTRRVTSHGFALNVNNDLSYFSHIIPCGLKGKGVTSLSQLMKADIRLQEVLKEVVPAFGQVFGLIMKEEDVIERTPDEEPETALD